MRIIGAQVAQGLRQLKDIFAVASTRPGRAGDVARDLRFIRRPEPGRVLLIGDVHDAFRGFAIIELQRHCKAQVTVLLAMIELLESRGRDALSHARAHRIVFGHQRGDAAGMVEGAAVVVRTLPQAPRPAADRCRPALDVREVDLVDQRAVAEHPHLLRIGKVAELKGSARVGFVRQFQDSCRETGVPCEAWVA